MNTSEWAVWGSAIATAASAIVVGVQAFHTAASAKASKDAVNVAQDTLREAQRTRLDSRSPKVVVSPVLSMHPVVSPEAVGGTQKEVEQEDLSIYRTPRDSNRVLTARLEFIARNDGDSPVELKASKQLRQIDGGWLPRFVVEPGSTRSATFKVSQPLHEWIRIQEAGSAEKGLTNDLAGTLTLTYSGPGDSDVDAAYVVEARGSIVVPIKGEEGGWKLQEDWLRDLQGVSLPTRFTYYKSRTTGDKL